VNNTKSKVKQRWKLKLSNGAGNGLDVHALSFLRW
jgi:hypothetical protein